MAAPNATPLKAPPSLAAQFFDPTTTLPDAFRELLEQYSHIPADQAEEHVIQLRNRAWDVHPYPCLGQFRFLELNLSTRADLYPKLLDILKQGGRFLDIGCCLGQDLRKLLYDGAPAANVAGAELNAAFLELGYDLFLDRDNTATKYVTANILEPIAGSILESFAGAQTVVQLGMILHLFTWEQQLVVFKNAIELLKEGTGTLIVGQAAGNLDGLETGGAWGKATFKHNVESFERLVKAVGEQTGTQWKVKATLDEGLSIYDGKRTWDDPKTRRLLFEIERV